MTGQLVAGALALVAVGGLLAAGRRTFTTGLWLQAAGALLLAVAGFAALLSGAEAGATFSSAFEPRVGIDGLTAFFLGLLGLVAAPALAFSTGYLHPDGRGRALAVLNAGFVLALAWVLCARDPLMFLAGWETMTLLPAAAILVAYGADRNSRHTAFVYVAITHLGGAGAWVAILLLAREGAIGNPAAIEAGSATQTAVILAALVGMGTKAGAAPFHVWLPRAHPVAPAPVSALMSGVMVKVAVYGLIRVLVEWSGEPPRWAGLVVLGLGALSALGGIVYALFQRDLKRVLAWSSIENVGIVLLGLGACLLLRSRGADAWAALALAAALLHALNHAAFKALLFLAAGAFEKAVGPLELDRLGGLLRRMPWTGAAFGVGAMAIVGLPPFNGFVSKWLTLQALLRVPAEGGVSDGIVAVVALAALVGAAALALLCFAKVAGLVLLGRPRRPEIESASEARMSMRAALAALALACLALGLAPGLLVGPLVGLAPGASAEPLAVGLAPSLTGTLPTGGLAIALAVAVALLLLLRGRRSAEPTPTWACGQAVESPLEWTSAGFTKPVRLVLEAVLRPRREVVVRAEGGVVQEITHRARVPHLIDERLYRPVVQTALVGAARARRLQTGRLGTYVLYLLGLVVCLLAAVRAGALG